MGKRVACPDQADVPCCRLGVCDTYLMHPAAGGGNVRRGVGRGVVVGAGGSPQRAINQPLCSSTTHLPAYCTKLSERRRPDLMRPAGVGGREVLGEMEKRKKE